MKNVLLIYVLCALWACSNKSTLPHKTEQEPVRYLALGDSYTIGESVDIDDRWPALLANRLSQAGVSTPYPTIVATTGWTTDELQEAIRQKELSGTYDLVTLLIGVNNQFRGYDIDQFEQEFAELLNFAIQKAGNQKDRVVVVSIPDWGVMPFAQGRDIAKIAKEIDAYNQRKQQIAEEKGVSFVNITDLSRRVSAQPELIAKDDLHPSGVQYALWVDRIFPIVLNNLR